MLYLYSLNCNIIMFDITSSLKDNASAKDSTGIICPIVKARKEIKTAGWFVKEPNLISGSSAGIDCEMSFGDMCFYMTARKLDVARFELTRPDLSTSLEYLRRMDFAGRDYQWLYKRIIQQLPSKMILYHSFTKTYELLVHLEDYIILKLTKNNKDSISKLNVSIPSLQLDKQIAMMVLYAPDALHNAIDAMCLYANSINIKSLTNSKHNKIINNVVTPTPIDLTTKMPKVIDNTASTISTITCMEKIKELLHHEMMVAEYIYKIEEFQAESIKVLNQLSTLVKSILSDG